MTRWQRLIGFLVTLWTMGALAQASREAEKAARDAAFARYELESLRSWLTHNIGLLHDRQLAMAEQLSHLPSRPNGGSQGTADDD